MARPTPEERFWAKVNKDAPNGCWQWTGALDGHGYGSFHLHRATRYAYHVAYEWARGPRPAGADLDHLCRTRACVTPDHLEPVSRNENLHRSPLTQTSINAAKTECIHGHAYTPDNTLIDNGFRRCKTCHYARNAARRARKRSLEVL